MEIAGVVLAAGHGTRLAPLTHLRPKALCPVNNEVLLDRALRAVAAVTPDIAVNGHALANQIVEHLRGRPVHVAVEAPQALGTAGALGNLRPWIDGRAVLVHNADAWHDAELAGTLARGWEGETMRLLAVDVGGPADFGDLLYAGVCLLPWVAVEGIAPRPSGLYEVLWRDRLDELELVVHAGAYYDCGTPASYLAANLHASGGASVVAPDAFVDPGATVVRSVVWPGARVGPGERLFDAIRLPGGLTLRVGDGPEAAAAGRDGASG